jgi:hypothetical protein
MAYIKLHGKEKLHCARCDEDVQNQMVHLDIPGQVVMEVLCADCDRIEHSPKEPQDKISFDVVDFGKIIFDLIELGASIGKEERVKR